MNLFYTYSGRDEVINKALYRTRYLVFMKIRTHLFAILQVIFLAAVPGNRLQIASSRAIEGNLISLPALYRLSYLCM